MSKFRVNFLIVFFLECLLLLAHPYSVYSQDKNFEIGEEVVVVTNGSNLNLRQGAGTNYPVIAKLPDGTIMRIVGGPIEAEGYQWWELEGDLGRGWAVGIYLESRTKEILPLIGSKEDKPFDWRAQLTCPSDREVFQGIEYCEGTYQGFPVHVLVVDLQATGIDFEYIIPKGYSDGHEGKQPCRDPNVPAWAGPAKGCYDFSRDKYPTIGIFAAAERAREVTTSSPLAAIINGDYGSPEETHGPEGLMVIQQNRYDGAKNCDDDYNAALRPWLGIAKSIDSATGQLFVQINRLEKDSDPIPQWLYTGIGGGPWLIQEGQIVPGSRTCQGVKILTSLEPIENCTGIWKYPKPAPLIESYNPSSCRKAPHTAVGISKDQRWLFFVITTENQDPSAITNFMLKTLGVWNAMKFDGGGSSQMLFLGPPEIVVDPSKKGRELSNYLALYASKGKGIILPLDAEPKEKMYYQVIGEGQTAHIQLEVTNSGAFTWKAEDGIELRLEPWSLLSPIVEALPLPKAIAPGETASWDWKINTSGVLVKRFQMYQKGEAFGPEFAVIVVVVPKTLENKREEIARKIQERIDQWKAQGEQELEKLVQQIEEWALKQITNQINTLCQSLISIFSLSASLLFLRIRRSN